MTSKDIIKKHKLKYSYLREIIIDILKHYKKPITPPKLLKHIQSKININKTSLYRQLETLSQKQIINKVMLHTNIAHFELSTHHHHHMVCEKCDSIECIADDHLEESIHTIEQKLQKKGLTIHNHHFSLSGLCQDCSS